MAATRQNDLADALRETRKDRLDVEQQIEVLNLRRDNLIKREALLRKETDQDHEEPLTVTREWLMHKLNLKKDSLSYFLKNSAANGFPKPIYLDSRPQWLRTQVIEWLVSRLERE